MRKGVYRAIGLLVGLVLIAFPSLAVTTQPSWDFKAEATSLLDQILYDASSIHKQLESLATPGLSRYGHAWTLGVVAQRVNAMAESLKRLREIRHVLNPWQVTAVSRLVKMQRELAQVVEQAIEELNNHGERVLVPTSEYNSLIEKGIQIAGNMRKDARVFLAYDRTHRRLSQLHERFVERLAE